VDVLRAHHVLLLACSLPCAQMSNCQTRLSQDASRPFQAFRVGVNEPVAFSLCFQRCCILEAVAAAFVTSYYLQLPAPWRYLQSTRERQSRDCGDVIGQGHCSPECADPKVHDEE
jgi:hypothetical protein